MNKFINLKHYNYATYIKNINYSYIFLFFFLIVLFLKLYLNNQLVALGDELNSILVYSSNIKTLLLKNFPGNTTVFHFFGYLISIFSYKLFYYKLLSYFFFSINTFLIWRFCKFFSTKLLFLITLLFSFYIPYYAFVYSGYFFSSFIFILIFLLVEAYLENQKKLSLIFFLLFINFYNHLVNLYIIFPLIFILYFYSKEKKSFFIKLFLYFFIPSFLFYLVSIIITGLAVMKVQSASYVYVLNFVNNNFFEIVTKGFNWIFFNKAYDLPLNLEVFEYLKSINSEDIHFFFSIIFLFILSFYFFIKRKKNYYFYISIILLHFLLIVILNKKIYPRSYTGFIFIYYFILLKYFEFFYYNLNKKRIFRILVNSCLIFLIFYKLISIDYQKRIYNGITSTDFTFEQTNIVKRDLILNDCKIKNSSYLEMEKKVYYYLYINECNKKFDLEEFLFFYRS